MKHDTEARAALSYGLSSEPVYRMVEKLIRKRLTAAGVFVDVGCGQCVMWPRIRDLFERGVGVDIIRYAEVPADLEVVLGNFDQGIPLPDASADLVVSLGAIEYLENPRAFLRELKRIARPGSWLLLTTSNQLNLLSKLSLLLRNQFAAFQDKSYPSLITALLECDLRRMAQECGLANIEIAYTQSGRMPGTAWHWPRFLGGRAFSDGVALVAQTPPCPEGTT